MKSTADSSAVASPNSLSIDIQVLRGISVLMVVLYHAFPYQLPYGYLGVDIFFVISGYVITGMLLRQGNTGAGALIRFYVRRAWRLLPSAYVVLLATTIAAGFILASVEFASYWEQLAGALSFTANMVLWTQAGYFDVNAGLKPLLHTWSLSVEEQFYLFWPAIFLTGLWRWRVLLVVAIAVGSLLLYLLAFKNHPNATFFLLPARCWQLGLGGVIFFLSRTTLLSSCLPNLRFQRPAWSLLFLGLIFLMSPWSIIPVTYLVLGVTFYAGLLVLLSGTPQPSLYLLHRPMSYAGDISYVLYLVHWPVFSLAHNVMVRGLDFQVTWILMAVSLILAIALHHGIETPLRHKRVGTLKSAFVFIAGALVIFIVATWLNAQKDHEIYAQIRAENYGMTERCDFDKEFVPVEACIRESTGKRVLVWGDSFAMHLVPGILQNDDWTVVQATKKICSPFAAIAPIYPAGGESQKRWSEKCLQFNASVMNYIQENSVDIVVLSSPFSRVIDHPGFSVLKETGEVVDASLQLAVDEMRETLSLIRQFGARPVVVSPTPVVNFDVALCVERMRTNLIQHGVTHDCSMEMSEVNELGEGRISFVQELARTEPVINLFEYLCDERRCPAESDEVIMYRDYGHLSVAGSRKLFSEFLLTVEMVKTAR